MKLFVQALALFFVAGAVQVMALPTLASGVGKRGKLWAVHNITEPV